MSLRHFPLALIVLLTATSCVVSVPVSTSQEPYTDDGRPVFTQGQGTRNPIIQSFTANPTNVTQGQAITFQVVAHDPDHQPLQFNWSTTDGTLSTNTGQVVSWIPPAKPGTYTVMVTVANGRGGFATGAQNLTVQPDGSAKIGPTPGDSAVPTVPISPTTIPSAATSLAPSAATSPLVSAPPQVTPSPSTLRAATVTTVRGLLDNDNQIKIANMRAVPGTSTLYFPSGQKAPYQSKFGTVDLSKTITVSDSSIVGRAYEFAFVGTERYYMNASQIGKPDGAIIEMPVGLYPYDLVVVGRHAYFRVLRSCLYRLDLDTGVTSKFAGEWETPEHRNGVGTEARFYNIQALTYNPLANALFVVDGTRIRKVTLAGEVSDFVGQTSTYKSRPVDGKGSAATMSWVLNLTSDDAGNLFFAEHDYGTLRMVSPDGKVTTIAGEPRTTRSMIDGIGTAASFANPIAITFGKFDGQPALFVGDHDGVFSYVRLVTGW